MARRSLVRGNSKRCWDSCGAQVVGDRIMLFEESHEQSHDRTDMGCASCRVIVDLDHRLLDVEFPAGRTLKLVLH